MLFKNLFKINLLLKTIICNYLIYIIFNFKSLPHNVGMFLDCLFDCSVMSGLPHNVGMFLQNGVNGGRTLGLPHNVGMFLYLVHF